MGGLVSAEHFCDSRDSVVLIYASGKLVARAGRTLELVSLNLAFLAPGVTDAILSGTQPSNLTLAKIPKQLPLSWAGHDSACLLHITGA
jgi:site-specific DNA recombinase